MVDINETELTEYTKTIYQYLFIKRFFKTIDTISSISNNPHYENLRVALADVRAVYDSLIFAKHYLEKIQKTVQPTLKEIELLLYGDIESDDVIKLMEQYDVEIDSTRNNGFRIKNAQNILNQLRETLFILKQFAYEQNIVIQKPFSRKFGSDAIVDVAEQ